MPSRKRSYDQFIDEVSLSEVQRIRAQALKPLPPPACFDTQSVRASKPRVRQRSVARRVQAVLEIFEGQLSEDFVKSFNRKDVVLSQKKTRKAPSPPPPPPVPPTPRKRISRKPASQHIDYSTSKILQALPKDAFARHDTLELNANRPSVFSGITALFFMGMTTWWAFRR